MKGIEPKEIEVDGKEVRLVATDRNLIAVNDLFTGADIGKKPSWVYKTCKANEKQFEKVSLIFNKTGHISQWFSTVDGMKVIYQELVHKYGVSDYTKKFYKFTEDIAKELIKMQKLPKRQSNQPLHLIAKVQNNRPLVSARDLHKALNVKTWFNDWVKQNFKDFEEGYDFTSQVVTVEVPNNGGKQKRNLKDYLLTLDMAKELCMLSRTEKGKQVRRYFIQVEKKYRQQKDLPQTPEQKLALTMQVTNRLVPRVSKLETDVDYLKNKAEIDSTQRYQLGRARNAKVVKICGGKKSNFYKQKKARKVYMQLFFDFKEQFQVPRYESVTKEQFEKALKFINNWYPSFNLKQEIESINNQTSLNI